MGNQFGPCQEPWPVTWTCQLDPATAPYTGTAVQVATEVLWGLSGRRYGPCTLTIRPCRRSCWDTLWPFPGNWWMWGQWPRPLFYQGVWYNLTCGQCPGNTCSCNVIDEALLPTPVNAIDSVKVAGAVLPPTSYQLRDYRVLMRTDGQQWPLCNNLAHDDTQSDTWSVTVDVGLPVPQLGQVAVGELACQLVKLLTQDTSCALPKPVQQLVRQGVTMNFLDPNEIFANGRIGLYLCDLFLSTENPQSLPERARVYDPDGDSYSILGLQ